MKRTRWPNVVELKAMETKTPNKRRTLGLAFFVDDMPLTPHERELCNRLLAAPFGCHVVHEDELKKLVRIMDRLVCSSEDVLLMEPEILDDSGGGTKLRKAG